MPSNVALSTDLWIQARPAIGCHLEQRDVDAVSFASRPIRPERPCCILRPTSWHRVHTLIWSLYGASQWTGTWIIMAGAWKRCTILSEICLKPFLDTMPDDECMHVPIRSVKFLLSVWKVKVIVNILNDGKLTWKIVFWIIKKIVAQMVFI